MKKVLYILTAALLSTQALALTVTNPNYQAEIYAQYSTSSYGASHDFCFGPDGEIYVTHHDTRFSQDGSVVKVDTLKNDSLFVSDLWSPMGIQYADGGDFGDYLYLSDADNRTYYPKGEITKIDLAGNTSHFAGGVDQPSALAIDTVGNYDGKMYIDNSAHDLVVRTVSAGGIATTFSSYWYERFGSIRSFVFDPGTKYNGKMYSAGTYDNQNYTGVFQIETDGSATQYYQIAQSAGLMIDNPDGLFNGSMFFTGAEEGQWWKLYMLNGMNDAESIALFPEPWTTIHLGPEGAMYAMEWNDTSNETLIYKITPVPEPLGVVLLGFGAFFARKRG